MKIKNIFNEIQNIYFDKNLDIRIQFYNLLAIVGIVVSIIIAFISVLSNLGTVTVIVNLMISPMAYIMLRIANTKKCYRLCSWIWVVSIFMIAFPALFFYCGGHRSGISCFFVLAIFFTALLLEKHERVIAIAVEFIIYISCSAIVYYRPETVVILPSDFAYVFHSILNLTSCGIIVLITVLMRNRMLYAKQNQVDELNRELKARNEILLRYDRMKSDFLAAVTHEINTPLAVISASSNDTLDLLDETPINIDEIRKNQMIIEKRVKLIDNIILDLMDTVAIENGRLSLHRQPVNLREFLINLCDVQFYKLDVNKNSLTYNLQQDLPQIWADPQRIEQVMINLLSNAVRHTDGGVITVGLAGSDKGQVVSVKDTGEGMDAETLEAVFKNYVSKKTDFWRHGIGLHICSSIITAHGGEIWIESEKGRGTIISFSLKEDTI